MTEFPWWAQTVGKMKKAGTKVKAICPMHTCCLEQKVDLKTISKHMGDDCSLINRRGGCRKYSCRGVVHFYYAEPNGHIFKALETPAYRDLLKRDCSMSCKKCGKKINLTYGQIVNRYYPNLQLPDTRLRAAWDSNCDVARQQLAGLLRPYEPRCEMHYDDPLTTEEHKLVR